MSKRDREQQNKVLDAYLKKVSSAYKEKLDKLCLETLTGQSSPITGLSRPTTSPEDKS